MRRNDKNRLLFGYAVSVARMVAVLLFLLVPILISAQARPSFEVLASSASELVVRIAPEYTFDTIVTENGNAVRVKFDGGSFAGTAGAPGEMKLFLPILLPSASSPSLEILSEQYEMRPGLELAPVPQYEKQDDIVVARYRVESSAYAASAFKPNYEFSYSGTARTAHSGEVVVYPVQYQAGTTRLLKELTIRIRFAGAQITDAAKVSPREAEYFQTAFVNGNVSDFYRSGAAAVTSAIRHRKLPAYKQTPAAADEKWIAVKATDEGVYRITASQLSQYGISNPDPATIALYGFGGKMMPEFVDSASGELAEVAIDVRTSGGTFSELRFYTPGTTDWRFSPENGSGKYYQIYHIKNPYSGSGHFLLKVGGVPAERRVLDNPDEVSGTPTVRDKVPAMALYENELKYEVPNISREFVGETITRGIDLNINFPQLPGYASDSTYMRPATNSRATENHTFEFKVNGTMLGTVSGRVNSSEYSYSARNWDSEFALSPSAGTPQTLTVTVNSQEKSPQYWFNFIEIYYQRYARLSDGQLHFFFANDASPYRISIPEANAELWDITDARRNVRLAVSSGSTLTADIQGPGKAMRRFVAFRESDLKSPELSSTGAPSLRSGICQTGAELIIIVPESYKGEGERLAEQRRRGGQATEPLSAEVVTVEDIYKEFGYGVRDVAAIRDFLAYTFRHTTANNTKVPLFVGLFARGHTDYQNRTTQIPIGIPDYETANFGSLIVYRSSHPEYIPDDAYFVRLMPRSNPKVLDMAPGRIAVQGEEEAATFVDKTIKYETSSDIGTWRARTVFVADDWYYKDGLKVKDPLPHLDDTEDEVRYVNKRLTVEKLYSLTYPNTFSSTGGRLKPELEAAIVDAFNNGSAMISFIGHGNPNVWTHEGILKVPSTINKLANLNRLSYLTTATCDFTVFDNYAELSGGVMLFVKPDGGIIGSMGTHRSVFGDESLVTEFYKKLFATGCSGFGTVPVGTAYVAGRLGGDAGNSEKFFILGDPSQRILVPRKYVVIETINGVPYDDHAPEPLELKALSQVTITGYIADSCIIYDPTFNGTATLTLKDAPTLVTQVTTFTAQSPSVDQWYIEGPSLYRGSATVRDGKFSVRFIVPKDIKFDTAQAKLQVIAFSDDFRSAMGAATGIRVFGIDTTRTDDTEGPELAIFIGNRRFRSGDVVPVHSKIIVDLTDKSGVNTSTSSIGHTFAGWVNDSLEGMFDLAEVYTSRQDDYTVGTAERQAVLPLGKNVLNVRAFDALNNPAEGSVEFIARDGDPYELYDVTLTPNPVPSGGTSFTFLQPSSPQQPVDARVTIFTVDGRKVRTLEALGVTASEIRIPWDVRDDGGWIVADGAYVYRIIVQDRLSGEETMSGGVFIVQKQQ